MFPPKNRRNFFLSLALAGALGSILTATVIAASTTSAKDTYEELETFASILAIVQRHYVDEVSTHDLVEGAVKGMVASLDPHSSYLTPEGYKELQIETHGEFGGLGIELTVRDNLLTIVTPIDGTPAFRAGIKPGDQIIKIGDDMTMDMPLQTAVERMRGKPGSTVKLSLKRKGVNDLVNVELTREVIHIKSVRGEHLVDGRWAYVKLTGFQDGSSDELVAALDKLDKEKKGGVDGIILDLRYNPGGLLTQAVSISDLFLDAGLIVRVNGRSESQTTSYFAKADGTRRMVPMIVLVNEGSASASEIVAGAMQDHRRALIVGIKSFGKGSVQTILPLGDDTALRLTTARYYTPSGRSIHEHGIDPDVVVEAAKPDANAKDKDEETPHSRDEFDPAHDPQLKKAIELMGTWKGEVPKIGGVAGFTLPESVKAKTATAAIGSPAAAAAAAAKPAPAAN
ncbi:MAG TPA: S41 family peptidase [Candidatus Binatia bacterium]